MPEKKIVYILGLGRSGTKLLDIILGNAEGAVSCGELNRYILEEGVPYQFPKGHPSVSFWAEIKRQFLAGFSANQIDQLRRLSRRYEYHTGFLRMLLANRPKGAFDKWSAFNGKLCDAILGASGANTIIDSSKYANRSLSISYLNEYDVSYIYLQRHPSDVVASFGKTSVEQNSRGWLSATAYYFFGSLLCTLAYNKLVRRGYKAVKVRLERLQSDPHHVLSQISEELKLDLTAVIKKLERDESLRVGNLFYGNRVRLEKEVKLMPFIERRLGFKDYLALQLNRFWYR